MIFLEGINNLAPFFAIIIGFILGIADFIISYYWVYGIMSWLMELLPEPND